MRKFSGWCGVLARGGSISSGVCTESYSVEEGMLPGIPRTRPRGSGGDEAQWGGGLGCGLRGDRSAVSFRTLRPGAGLPVSSEAGLARQGND